MEFDNEVTQQLWDNIINNDIEKVEDELWETGVLKETEEAPPPVEKPKRASRYYKKILRQNIGFKMPVVSYEKLKIVCEKKGLYLSEYILAAVEDKLKNERFH